MAKPAVVAALGFVLGAAAGGAGVHFTRAPAPVMKPAADGPASADDDELRKANQNLTESLQACDRRLVELHEPPMSPTPVASAEANERDRGRGRDGDGGRGRRGRGELSREDWERMAEQGVVPVRIPCVRDKPWTPSERVVDRLGLAPSDTEVLKEAYERSNKRVVDELRPLCAKVLGLPDAVDKMGASVCMDAIAASARKANPDATRESLKHTAEVQAGKRPAPGKEAADLPPIERLSLFLSSEAKTFEADLAQKLGPEEARRLATAPELCSDRRMLRADDEVGFGPGGPGARGRAR